MSRRFRLKPAGYVVLAVLVVVVILCVYAIAKAISGGGAAQASPTPILPDAALASPTQEIVSATVTPVLETPTPTPSPMTSTPTPPVIVTKTPSVTKTPDAATRTPTSAEKKNAMSGKVTGDGVKLRSGPSTQYEVVKSYDKDTEVLVYATDGEFYFLKMEKDSVLGYMSKKYVDVGAKATIPSDVPTDAVGGQVTASTVALRKGPNKTDTAITELHSGDILYVYYKTNEFYYVEVVSSGKKGFAFASYVKVNGTVPTK